MNAYEQKQEERRQRYEERAAKASQESVRRADMAIKRLPSCGSPILIGHHSEKRHRRAIEKSDQDMRRAVEAEKKALHYASKAASVGTAGISSDDPDALPKLREKLAELEASQEMMKASNALVRKHKGSDEELIAALVNTCGLTDKEATALVIPPAHMPQRGRGFRQFQLTNNNANIRRVKERIAFMEKEEERHAARQEQGKTEQQFDGFQYKEDVGLHRVMFIFDGKPDEATRQTLKGFGFRWAPSNGAWQRQLNPAGRNAAQTVIRHLTTLK